MAKRPIKNVGLIVKRDSPQALAIARDLVAWITARGLVALAEGDAAREIKARPLAIKDLAHRAELIVVLGGDGTLLAIARLIGERETPILGINLGGLGFLTQATIEEARSLLERVLAGDYEIDRRIMLEASVTHGGRGKAAGAAGLRAFNDVVINKREIGTMLEIEVVADRKPFCSYRADGLIVATPTGSTAYALSAGGPIVFPTLEVMVLAPICPHTLSNRPVVLPDTFELEIRVIGKLAAALTLDGQQRVALRPGDAVKVRKSRSVVALIRSTHPYFEIWRDKLRWG